MTEVSWGAAQAIREQIRERDYGGGLFVAFGPHAETLRQAAMLTASIALLGDDARVLYLRQKQIRDPALLTLLIDEMASRYRPSPEGRFDRYDGSSFEGWADHMNWWSTEDDPARLDAYTLSVMRRLKYGPGGLSTWAEQCARIRTWRGLDPAWPRWLLVLDGIAGAWEVDPIFELQETLGASILAVDYSLQSYQADYLALMRLTHKADGFCEVRDSGFTIGRHDAWSRTLDALGERDTRIQEYARREAWQGF